MTDPGVTCEIDSEQRIAILTWTQEPKDFLGWKQHFEKVLVDPRFRPDFGIISDWRGLREAPTNSFVEEFLEALQQARARKQFSGRWATVVSTAHPAVFGVGRMTEMRAELKGLEYRIYRDLQRAVLWASRAADDKSRA